MYEAHEVMAGVLFGGLGLYLVVFWGSTLISYIVGDYLNDGDVEVWSLPKQIDKSWDWCVLSIYGGMGLIFPTIFLVGSSHLIAFTKTSGWAVPWFFASILGIWIVLYTLRGVIRLKKDLKKHENDANAHKGSE